MVGARGDRGINYTIFYYPARKPRQKLDLSEAEYDNIYKLFQKEELEDLLEIYPIEDNKIIG